MKLILMQMISINAIKFKIEKTISGGSVANSIVGLSQLGNDVGFIEKVSDDNWEANTRMVKIRKC